MPVCLSVVLISTCLIVFCTHVCSSDCLLYSYLPVQLSVVLISVCLDCLLYAGPIVCCTHVYLLGLSVVLMSTWLIVCRMDGCPSVCLLYSCLPVCLSIVLMCAGLICLLYPYTWTDCCTRVCQSDCMLYSCLHV